MRDLRKGRCHRWSVNGVNEFLWLFTDKMTTAVHVSMCDVCEKFEGRNYAHFVEDSSDFVANSYGGLILWKIMSPSP